MLKDSFYFRFKPNGEWHNWEAAAQVAGFASIIHNVLKTAPNEHIKIVNLFDHNYFAMDGNWLWNWGLLKEIGDSKYNNGVFVFYQIHVTGGTIYDADHPGMPLSNWEFHINNHKTKENG